MLRLYCWKKQKFQRNEQWSLAVRISVAPTCHVVALAKMEATKAEQGIAESRALESGMQEKGKEFIDKGAKLYVNQ